MGIRRETRVAIVDALDATGTDWAGRLDPIEFLNRLYDLDALPSNDRRFETAGGDIWQHTVNNDDWPLNWVFHDDRFGLLSCSDDEYLTFLETMLHFRARNEPEAEELAELLNRHIVADGYWLYETTDEYGNRAYTAGPANGLPPPLKDVGNSDFVLSHANVGQELERIRNAITTDVELAIGSSKNLVEAVCKSVLVARQVEYDSTWKLPQLTRATLDELDLMPTSVEDDRPAAKTIKKLLGNLSFLAYSMAELRNTYGSGHGRDPRAGRLQPRHARLAVGAATTFVHFVLDTHESRL